ncbi:oxidoreductase [Fulvivirga imtechensis AK7]|uniref:Oxidoreductase n=1 Tax=Fulvivirga imtechensis AK7 TaxID=1237149 RepID=L8JYF0_9BACT|nr:SDR family oxidoreductase [Fulvivirga imtechensis]ELR73795.1 oxidoreductase [Fulvivirga imtechensis AK7]
MVVLVTGASSGIGQVIADHLSSKGHVVYGTSRSIQTGEYGFNTITMDVTDISSVRTGVELIIQQHGHIDAVINNAGIGILGALEYIPADDIKKLFNTNVVGMVNVCQAVIPFMRKKGDGKIINISSIGSEMGLPYRAPYSASKAAVDRLTEALRIELGSFGIRLCSIQPGGVATDIEKNRLKAAMPSDSPYQESFTRATKVINDSVSKGLDPRDIAILVEKLIHAKRLKRTYRVGKTKEKFAVVIKRILPSFLFENMLKKNYQI